MELGPLLRKAQVLPADAAGAVLVGRAWIAGDPGGPSPVLVRGEDVLDLSSLAPTVAQLLERYDLAAQLATLDGLPSVGRIDALLAASAAGPGSAARTRFLAPVDLQVIKASGVTFVTSLLERVIEEQARGDPAQAQAIRARIDTLVGGDLSAIRPGSEAAMALKKTLVEQGAWSQYLEVGIGPDAEIFTKCPPLASVGLGADIGILRSSTWNNPEPEVVLVVNARGEVVGATLGNDVNLRDVEGRSALLLGRAKDNNASSAIGPFVRLFDGRFTIDTVRAADVALRVEGDDGYTLEGVSSLSKISRDPLEIVRHAMNENHQYPDGLALYLGTMFAPIQDRDTPGQGFTHKPGDRVTISTPSLGALVNRVRYCDEIEPWQFGAGALMRNLAQRGLLKH
ncbi:MAG: fumarylacetoacetate hydrolase [Betaproteobacteria bacterium SG8_39]|nr:MAG: fumarylacetoacetate hydrolase [Betaproteobacteria bacterium SG8_39]